MFKALIEIEVKPGVEAGGVVCCGSLVVIVILVEVAWVVRAFVVCSSRVDVIAIDEVDVVEVRDGALDGGNATAEGWCIKGSTELRTITLTSSTHAVRLTRIKIGTSSVDTCIPGKEVTKRDSVAGKVI